ncbi:meiosis inhibitor protein 1 isoform X2 [Melanotaenia boesemani]|uniref:meiosis inhibitor protein 1 isoform X2 n=1 Tax=Melanotaenia boesemani TaxID=1250792 RepID=UPI001C05351B|nr:meiosis inhibitor protein 1 isoform X2 [Melanotaenia boesemani]
MTMTNLVYDKIHFRHDLKWSVSLRPAEDGGVLFCVACVIEMMETEDIASVRKSFALSNIIGVMKSSPGTLRELLRQDHRVALHFIATLLVMLQTMEDPVTLEKVDQVLVQLLLELQNELSFHLVLDEIHKQLSNQQSMKPCLPTFNFLGNLVKAVPNVARSLVTQYVPLLDQLCSALLYPDEALKTSVVYVWLQLLGAAGDTAAQSLPIAIRDRVCVQLLQTFANASSALLIKNCVGLLWHLVQVGEAVSVLMNSPGSQMMCDENQDILANNSQALIQNQEQQPTDQCLLPLLLKKVLLSGDEMLQLTSAKCIAAILVHTPREYSTFFIKADTAGFLFDRLACSSSEMLLWCVYSCLVLLTEDTLFFSQCHSVYGIEYLVRSLKEALQMTSLEVPKQGFVLLTEILERQPPSVHLFPSGSGFVAVSEAVVAGVSSPCLLVAAQAASAGASLFRLNHQSRPVQFKELEALIKAITERFSELLVPSPAHWRKTRNMRRSNHSGQIFRSERFLVQALVCFQAACRLAEQCASDPVLMENPFTAPNKKNKDENSLESLCQCLLHCCDSVWMPTVLRMCEQAPNAQILQYVYSILSSQFALLPSLMPAFATKLASSGFFRLALEHKGLFCSGNRNPDLNASCCSLLQKLSMCLLFQSDSTFGSSHDFEEVKNLLQCNLPSLCFHLSDWPSLLCEYQEPRTTQYCVVIVLYLALQHGDRLLPDQTVFSSVVWLLQSVQEQGSCALPRSVLRSALYLLAVTQDKSPNLDGVPLNYISKALSSCQSFSSLYFHHPALLHFICRYPELSEKFGALLLEMWLTMQAQHTDEDQTLADMQEKAEKTDRHGDQRQVEEQDTETMELLTLTEKYPNIILTLLDMVSSREAALAERVLGVLEVVLNSQRRCITDLCANLRPALLQELQRIGVENMAHGLGHGLAAPVNSLPLLLKLLCVIQTSDPPSPPLYCNMEGVHFKLLYHVSSIVGMLKPTNTESLLPALNYLYCCLSLSPAHSTDRAVSMLLSNSRLMDQLQAVISSSSALSPPSPSACPPSSLLCCSHLLLSSLITLQRVHSTQVHKSISWSLDTAVQRILLQKRNTNNLLLVSYLRLLEVLLDVDLASAVVCVSTSPGLVGPRPLGVEDGALYPLGTRGALFLLTTLSGLLLQKHEFLVRASVNCLSSLLGFLKRRTPATAKYVVCQPWLRFLLYCLLSSGESCPLHPAILRLITVLLQYNSTVVLWEPDLLHVVETVEKRGVKELSQEAAQALRLLLIQIQSSVSLPSKEHKLRVRKMMEALEPQTSVESCNPSLSSNILCVGDVSICLSDFTLKTR